MTVFACGLIRWEEVQKQDKDVILAKWLASHGVRRVVGQMRASGKTSAKLEVSLDVRNAFGWPTSQVMLMVNGSEVPHISPLCEIPA